MQIKTTKFPGWNQHPCYWVEKFEDYNTVTQWMNKNSIRWFLLASGSGYTFQVQDNNALFLLTWL